MPQRAETPSFWRRAPRTVETSRSQRLPARDGLRLYRVRLASLPASGNRVGPANVAKMPRISTPNVSSAIQFLPGSNHWRLIGLEITTSYVSTGNTVYCLVTAGLQSDGATAVNAVAQLPTYLIFDRIYIHGLPTTNTKRGIQMDTQSIGIVDSYCDEIHYNGNDSQCFASWNGAGPYLIQNNFIQAGAEDIMFGGADPSIANLVPQTSQSSVT